MADCAHLVLSACDKLVGQEVPLVLLPPLLRGAGQAETCVRLAPSSRLQSVEKLSIAYRGIHLVPLKVCGLKVSHELPARGIDFVLREAVQACTRHFCQYRLHLTCTSCTSATEASLHATLHSGRSKLDGQVAR